MPGQDTSRARRRELLDEYKRTPPEAGVYRIVNQRTQRALLGSSLNLASVRGKLDFAQSTGTPGALDHRLGRDAREFGLEAFAFEVLEVLEIAPDRTAEQTQADLEALEALWRERLADAELY